MSLRAAIGVPEDAQRITVDGVELAVAREGSGPPVVCLHAIGHGGGDFAAFAAAVRDRFEVIRIDWPGQGRSGEDARPASATRYADLLEGALAALGVARPIIVGNSIGGAAALICADRIPVRALVLCDPGGVFEIDATVRRFCGAFAWFFRAGVRRAWWYRAAFGLYYRLVLPSPAARDQRRRIVAAAYEIAPPLAQAWEAFARPEADIRALAAGLEAPIWLAWAKGDKVTQLDLARPAIATLRRAQLTEFPGGHAAFLEQPEAFVRGFTAFMDGLDPQVSAMETVSPSRATASRASMSPRAIATQPSVGA